MTTTCYQVREAVIKDSLTHSSHKVLEEVEVVKCQQTESEYLICSDKVANIGTSIAISTGIAAATFLKNFVVVGEAGILHHKTPIW